MFSYARLVAPSPAKPRRGTVLRAIGLLWVTLAPQGAAARSQELDEVEDVPREEDVVEVTATELAPTATEVRGRYHKAVALALGPSTAWQQLAVEAGQMLRGVRYIGMVAGGGGLKSSGMAGSKAYDLSLRSQGVGVTYRRWLRSWDQISAEGSLGYAEFSGHIAPHGSDDETATAADKLASTVHLGGLVASLAVAVTWTWDNGFFLQWVPVGIESTKLIRQSYSQAVPLVRSAVRGATEHTRVFGLADLRLGYYF